MATTFTGPRAGAGIVPVDPGMGFVTFGIPGWIDIATNPTANDVYELCWLPAGFVCTGGFIYSTDFDVGTEALDMDLGWASNGGSGTYDAADSDGLGNFGVWNGDAFATGNISIVAGNIMSFAGAFLSGTGVFPYFTKKTKVQALCNVTANSFSAGRLSIICNGYVDPSLRAG